VRTIAIVNQKGGCGKTTTAINLSAVFAHRGLRTLLVDMDPQSHCAIGLGVPEQGVEQGVAEALLKADCEGFDPPSAVWEVGGNLDLLPSTMRLAGLEAPGGGLHELPDRDRRLTHLVGRFAGQYDRCLIDCPPTIGLLTFNALRAAREALIPVETGFFALRGADRQWRTIRQLIERIGRPIACHLLPTLYNADSALAVDILAALRRQFAGQVIPMVVNEDEVVREAASFGQPVIEYAPQSRAREDFEKLADWLSR
jgi:chromosome partitioning protein